MVMRDETKPPEEYSKKRIAKNPTETIENQLCLSVKMAKSRIRRA